LSKDTYSGTIFSFLQPKSLYTPVKRPLLLLILFTLSFTSTTFAQKRDRDIVGLWQNNQSLFEVFTNQSDGFWLKFYRTKKVKIGRFGRSLADATWSFDRQSRLLRIAPIGQGDPKDYTIKFYSRERMILLVIHDNKETEITLTKITKKPSRRDYK